MKPSNKLVFFGTEDFSLPSLKALVDAGYTICAVVTKPDSARGRSKKLVAPAVKIYAQDHGLPVLQPTKLADINDQLASLQADAAILVSYGKLLPQRTLDVFSPIGVINLHPSMLSKYRGPAPIEAPILHDDKTTGISIMRLTLGMDEGPIFAQMTYPLTGTETKPELTGALAKASAQYLVEQLPAILSGQLKAVPQQNDDVSYTTLITKEDGILNPLTDTAQELERKVRAYLSYPKARLRIGINDVIVTSAKVATTFDAHSLVITCSSNTSLEILELIAPSGKKMTGSAYKRGYSA